MALKQIIRSLLTAVLALAAGIVMAAPPVPAEPAVKIVHAEFGLFESSKPEELTLVPTNVVPLVVGQHYGWVIEVQTTRRRLAVREEYVTPLPVTAQIAPSPLTEYLTITDEKRVLHSQKQLVPLEGKIYGESVITPSDRSGHRRLQVVVEGQVGASFEFDVE